MDRPSLYSPRLCLRVMSHEDLPALIKYANNSAVAERIINIPYPFREPDAAMRLSRNLQGFNRKTHYTFAIVLRETDELIGEVGLHPLPNRTQGQLAYWIGEPYWGKGLATEAVRAVLSFGFNDLALQLIFAECKVDNFGSIRVLEKNGMTAVGRGQAVEQYYLKAESWGTSDSY